MIPLGGESVSSNENTIIITIIMHDQIFVQKEILVEPIPQRAYVRGYV